MKHRHLDGSTAWKAGYNAPAEPKSKKGGKFPHMQPFHKPTKKEK
jgi:hypothetical protein